MRRFYWFALVAIVAVTVLPADAQVVTSTVGTQVNPASAAVDSTRNLIYVANNCGSDHTCSQGGGSVTIINGATNSTTTVS